MFESETDLEEDEGSTLGGDWRLLDGPLLDLIHQSAIEGQIGTWEEDGICYLSDSAFQEYPDLRGKGGVCTSGARESYGSGRGVPPFQCYCLIL